jgi:cysteinyl-tRNA synthetase
MRFTDTLTGSLVEFEPREPGKVSLYACGPTVYDDPHIGHAYSALVYDVLRRYLTWRGFDVIHVANITDIDDKIIKRALEEESSEPEVAARYEASYISQMRSLGIQDPHLRPHATDYVEQMIAVIAELVDSGHAYATENGVYFEVASYANYGALVHRTPDDLREGAGARVEVDAAKRDPLDFALWKAAKPGDPVWESPWGPGRPGWHIECVAMSLDILGDGFDIHGGGDDLIFPHHENERSEAEAASHPFAQIWMHHGMLNVAGEKMSKSLGNFTTLGALLDKWDPRAFRLVVLQTHYRSSMEISDEKMDGAVAAIERLDAFHRRAGAEGIEPSSVAPDVAAAFTAAMDNDLGTPSAVATVFEQVRAGHSAIDSGGADTAAQALASVLELAGVLGLEPPAEESDDELDRLVGARQAAREARDFAAADRIRDDLHDRGIEVEDTPSGPIWRRIR